MRRPSAEHELPAAVVDVGWVNGLAAIRSLGRAGIRVLGVDHRPSALGFRSRYAERFLSADPHTDPTRFIAFIRALGEVVVFPTHDEQLNLIAQHLGDLEVLAPFPGWDVLGRVQSKRAQLEEAAAAGVDVPRTRYPRTAPEARAAAEELGLPVLVKPEHPVEFKRDARDGKFKLMEINPRLWQWHGLAAACGIDLPRIAYADLVGETPKEATMNGEGKRWAITLLPGERPAVQRVPYVDAVFARDDPKPAAVHLARVVRSAFR